MDVLVVVLDGLSYVFANVFCWWGESIRRLWSYPGAKRCMMYVDVIPETPTVMATFFQLRKFVPGTITTWVWDLVTGRRVKAINIPACMPPIYHGVPRPANWVDFFSPPKERFREVLMKYHSYVKANGDADILFVWYPVPDQPHHHFFSTIPSIDALRTAIEWYDLACKLALDLIETFKPRRWLVVSDHGFTSDVRDTPIPALYHIRDATAITNFDEPPRGASEVVYWVVKALGLVQH